MGVIIFNNGFLSKETVFNNEKTFYTLKFLLTKIDKQVLLVSILYLFHTFFNFLKRDYTNV